MIIADRPTARLILADPRDRVLLFRFVPPAPWPKEPSWHLPGGGIEPGETPAQAAAREALEETGHVLDPAALGEPVAVNEGTWSNEGRHFHTVSSYFFARVAAATVAPTVREDHVSEQWLNGNRWWSAGELAATRERVFPPGLAALLPGLLTGTRPVAAVRLPWTTTENFLSPAMSRRRAPLRPPAGQRRRSTYMSKLIYWVHTSLDGHIHGPNGEFDWARMGPELSAYGDEVQARVGTFLYGRVVWEMMSGYWPHAESMSDDPHDLKFAPIWRSTPKVVFSTTLREAGWNTRIVSGDLGKEVAELKRQAGDDLLLNGGSRLASALTALGLIDEYHVMVHPVVLGGGLPLFPPQERMDLRLADSRVCDGRTAVLRYDRVR